MGCGGTKSTGNVIDNSSKKELQKMFDDCQREAILGDFQKRGEKRWELWRKRRFVVERGMLFYYQIKKAGLVEKGTVDLNGARLDSTDVKKDKKANKDLCFDLHVYVPQERVFLISLEGCDDQLEEFKKQISLHSQYKFICNELGCEYAPRKTVIQEMSDDEEQ